MQEAEAEAELIPPAQALTDEELTAQAITLACRAYGGSRTQWARRYWRLKLAQLRKRATAEKRLAKAGIKRRELQAYG